MKGITSPTAVQPQSLGRRSPVTPELTGDYQGPILVVAGDAIVDGTRLAANTEEMLQNVRQSGAKVPMIYLPQTTAGPALDTSALPFDARPSLADLQEANGSTALSPEGYLQGVQMKWPNAKLFVIGSNAGPTVNATRLADVTTYLRNTDPTQAQLPAEWKGILTDQFFDSFRQRIAVDMENSRRSSEAGATLLPTPEVYPNAPKITPPPAPNIVSRVLGMVFPEKPRILCQGLLPGLAEFYSERLRNRDLADKLAPGRNPSVDLSSKSALELGQAIAGLSHRIMAGNKSQQLFQMMTAHGADAGHVDSILSCVNNEHVLNSLSAPERAAYDKIQADGAPVPGDWNGFEKYMDHLTGTKMEPGNDIKVCVGGDEIYHEVMGAINKANEFIVTSTYSLNSDQTGRAFVSALEKALERGAKVTLVNNPTRMYKAYGKFEVDPELLAPLKKFEGFTYLESPDSPMDDHINHRKLTVCDNGKHDGGVVAFSGGANFGNKYRAVWQDVHSRILGPATRNVGSLLLDLIGRYDPSGKSTPDAAMQAKMLNPQAPIKGGVEVRVVGHQGRLDHNPKYMYLRALKTAARTIDIQHAYVSDPDVMRTIMERAKAGVKVRLFLPEGLDEKPLKYAEKAWYKELLATGNLELYEYTGHEMAHEKVMVIDGHTTIIASSNLDQRSMWNNDEADVLTNDPATAADVTRRLFDANQKKSVRILSYNPSFLESTFNHTARMFSSAL